MYDTILSHNLAWPCLSCRFGDLVAEDTERQRRTSHVHEMSAAAPAAAAAAAAPAAQRADLSPNTLSYRRIYLSEQVTEGCGLPNTILVATAAVPKARTSDTVECASTLQLRGKCRSLRVEKTIVHPGEVNRIRELPTHPHVVATQTDVKEVYVWDTAAFGGLQGAADLDARGGKPDVPTLTLAGHTDVAQFALAASPTAPRVASGGQDAAVLVWNLEDALGSAGGGAGGAAAAFSTTTLQPMASFCGLHKKTVEDVVFHPKDAKLLASVADDRAMCVLDVRNPRCAAIHVKGAHNDDAQCIDWCTVDDTKIATGGADGVVKVFDIRMAGLMSAANCVAQFKKHTASVLRVSWHPTDPCVLASSGEDGLLYVWEMSEKQRQNGGSQMPSAFQQQGAASPSVEAPAPATYPSRANSSGVLFCHAGHPSDEVVDFQFDPNDPWTVMSMSNDSGANGGSTMQIWRISDLITRTDAEVEAELDQLVANDDGGGGGGGGGLVRR